MPRKLMAIGLVIAVLAGLAMGVRQMMAKDEPVGKGDELKKQLDEFVAMLKAEDYKGLFAHANEINSRVVPSLVEGGRSLPDATIASTMFRKQMEQDSPGKFTGEIELVSKEVLGSRFIRYQLVQWHERGGTVWRLAFFRTADGWMVQELSWDGKIANHLKPVTP